MKLFQLTHRIKNDKGENTTLYVAAQDMKRVAETYDQSKIELVMKK